jgi:hypothetical protein
MQFLFYFPPPFPQMPVIYLLDVCRHGVSMGQQETEAERQQAVAQGKAVSTVIGIRSMGLGFNRLMTVQVPIKQHRRHRNMGFFGAQANKKMVYSDCMAVEPQMMCASPQESAMMPTLGTGFGFSR